jgi:hypothetical protein
MHRITGVGRTGTKGLRGICSTVNAVPAVSNCISSVRGTHDREREGDDPSFGRAMSRRPFGHTRFPNTLVTALILASSVLLFFTSAAQANHSVQDLISIGPAGGNGTFAASFTGASEDGSRVFFETREPLVAADSDANCVSQDDAQPSRLCTDVYERFGGVTTLISTGPSGGSGAFDARFLRASADGSRVFFTTAERLVSADSDTMPDVYQTVAGTTTLVSTGPLGGNGNNLTFFGGASNDGARVFFATDEALVSSDTDTANDVYERSSGSTTLISTGPIGGNSSTYHARFVGASDTGTIVFFETEESLVSTDSDGDCGEVPDEPPRPCTDVYSRSNATTSLVSTSTGPLGNTGAFDGLHLGMSSNGVKAIFSSAQHLQAIDTDAQFDVFQRINNNTTLVSTGPNGGNGAYDVAEALVSSSGGHVLFETRESLVSTDTDTSVDLYDRSGTTTTLISIGTAGRGNGAFDADMERISPDGSRVFFSTSEQLIAADTDSSIDVYQRLTATPFTISTISTGPTGANGPFDATLAALSSNGTRVFFETAERMTGNDTDSVVDVFERAGGTVRISTGPLGGNAAAESTLAGVSADGLFVFIETGERMLSSDTDDQRDIYVSSISTPAPCTNRYKPSDLTNFQGQLNNLPDAAVACLDTGVYGTERTTQKITNDRLTIRSTPGQLATLKARLWVVGDRVTISDLILNGATTPPPTAPTVSVNADSVLFERVEVTNQRSPASCFSNDGALEGGPAESFGITKSVVYDCGLTAGQHGIDLGSAYRAYVDDNWIYENADEGVRIGPATSRLGMTRNVIADNCSSAISSCNGNLAYVENGYTGLVNHTGVDFNTVAFPHAGNNAASVTVDGDNNAFVDNCVWRSDGMPGVNLPQPPFAVSYVTVDPAFVDHTNTIHAQRNYSIPGGNPCAAKGPSVTPGP